MMTKQSTQKLRVHSGPEPVSSTYFTKIVLYVYYVVGTKEKRIEPSLDELQKEAIFIPDSALTTLTEIGEGIAIHISSIVHIVCQ